MNTEFLFGPESLITATQAKQMVQAYGNHKDRLPVHNGDYLRALILEKEDLESLLSNGADKAMIIFAVRSEDTGRPSSNQHFTTILAGVKNRKIMMDDLRNMFSPCPNNCFDFDAQF